MSHRLSSARIVAAMDRIPAVFRHTPQYPVESLDDVLGCRLVVKVETTNPIRSFKGRGACAYVAERMDRSPLVCASAGNFGQAMAWACRARGIPLVVYAATQANPLKVDRMRALGAEVRLAGLDFDAAKEAARHVATRDGLCYVEDGLVPTIAEGAGTIGVELTQDPVPFDSVLLPLGNGALATGVGCWFKAQAPTTRVVAVAAAGAPSMVESWQGGRIITYDRIDTIADGIGVRMPIPEAVADMHGTIDDAVLVREDTIVQAMRLLHEHTGLVVEPSGAAGVAAILEHPARWRGQRVVTVLCGSNVTAQQRAVWLRA